MYTIFIDDIPIYLTDNLEFSSRDNFFYKDEITIETVLQMAKSKQVQFIYLYNNDLKNLWKEFKWFFKIERAAGGLVMRSNEAILFIKRFNKWDLPKGKIEKGEKKKEAAIREVEEECGISGLVIESKISKTYHVFQRKKREILKVTHWYKMNTSFDGLLKPQLEEGITEVMFKNKNDTEKALMNTYGNIKLLFNLLEQKVSSK